MVDDGDGAFGRSRPYRFTHFTHRACRGARQRSEWRPGGGDQAAKQIAGTMAVMAAV